MRKSHLLQMRGLKHADYICVVGIVLSHLLQMRGLKLETDKTLGANAMSHLLQMRGLKHDADWSNEHLLCRIFYRCVD